MESSTRKQIVDAARRQFAASGYLGSSIKAIASQAQVSVQTMYDTVGRKADLMRALIDTIRDDDMIMSALDGLDDEVDALTILELPARIVRLLVERHGDLLAAGVTAVMVEPDLEDDADLVGRTAIARLVAERLFELGHLRPVMTLDATAMSIATICDHRLAMSMMADQDMDPFAVQRWMTDTLSRTLLSAMARSERVERPALDLRDEPITLEPTEADAALDPAADETEMPISGDVGFLMEMQTSVS